MNTAASVGNTIVNARLLFSTKSFFLSRFCLFVSFSFPFSWAIPSHSTCTDLKTFHHRQTILCKLPRCIHLKFWHLHTVLTNLICYVWVYTFPNENGQSKPSNVCTLRKMLTANHYNQTNCHLEPPTSNKNQRRGAKQCRIDYSCQNSQRETWKFSGWPKTSYSHIIGSG